MAENQRVRGLPRIEPSNVVGRENLFVLGLCYGVVLGKVLVRHESVSVHPLALMQPQVDEFLGGAELIRRRDQQALEHVADVSYVELGGREVKLR